MLQKHDYVKIMKIAAGAGLAIVLAESLGLRYSSAAGVITLLSIQDTKKETIRVMARRLFSFGAALVLSAACFAVFGYGAVSVAVFLLFFSAFCMRFHMQEGISVNTVLVTHFLAERSMSLQNIGNELAILMIGAGIGVILNLYIPGKEKQIQQKQRQIEDRMRTILRAMENLLSPPEGQMESGVFMADGPMESSVFMADSLIESSLRKDLAELEGELVQGERNAYEEMENKLLTETRYYLRYMNMRKSQASVLGRIAGNIARLHALPPQAGAIAHLLKQISASFHEYNNAIDLLKALEEVKRAMREQPLPADREEFENRAVLYDILLELEHFLAIKKEFVGMLTAEEIRSFWKMD